MYIYIYKFAEPSSQTSQGVYMSLYGSDMKNFKKTMTQRLTAFKIKWYNDSCSIQKRTHHKLNNTTGLKEMTINVMLCSLP